MDYKRILKIKDWLKQPRHCNLSDEENLIRVKKEEDYYKQFLAFNIKPMVGKELEYLVECLSLNSISQPTLPNRL